MLGQSASDVAIYQLDVNQVCPVSGTLDCVPNQHFVRTPISLPSDIRAGNVALNSQGNQLSLVGHTHGEDVIAVVAIPQGNGSGGKTNPGKGQPTAFARWASTDQRRQDALTEPDRRPAAGVDRHTARR